MNLFVVPTVRFDEMKRLVVSWKRCPALKDWKWAIAFQEYSNPQRLEISNMLGDAVHYEKGYGVRIAPYLLRDKIYAQIGLDEVDAFCAIDDDMQFVPGRDDYQTAVEKAKLPDVGVVVCNCVRFDTEKMWAKAPHQPGVFIEIPILNLLGGMVFTKKVIEASHNYPVLDYLVDDIQFSLVSYLAGYDNYKYMGCTALHSFLTKGGLKTLYTQRSLTPPDQRYLTIRKDTSARRVFFEKTDNNWCMPVSEDLTQEAKEIHDANSAEIHRKMV